MSGDEKAKREPGDAKVETLADRVQTWQSEGRAILRAMADQAIQHHKAIVPEPAPGGDDAEDRSDDDRASCD
jgi:hypothetical protein